jgi:hypothetical protein
MAQKLWDNISKKLEFREATLDIWIDSNNQLHLIEINTYGSWTASGSSWFDWESDFPQADDINSFDDVPFRLTYPNGYFDIRT